MTIRPLCAGALFAAASFVFSFNVGAALAENIPTEQDFLDGAPVIHDFLASDKGRRGTGMRLTGMGLYYVDGQAVASAWRIRNSRDVAQSVNLSAHRGNFSTDLIVPANSQVILLSDNVRYTHILSLGGRRLDTKAPHTGKSYRLPAVPEVPIDAGEDAGENTDNGDQTGGDQTGGDQTGGDQTGGDQTGGDQTGGDQTGDDQNPGTDDGVDPRFARGMAAWRKPDEIFKGAACANCHSPDGFDLAYFDFSREDIIRRAAPHLPDLDDQNAVADLVEYLREKHNITEPKDPRTFRPFQPGSGEVLPGANRHERDEALGQQFKDKGYRFTHVPVLSLQEAHDQRDEWLSIDVRDIDLGIAFPLWSRDGFHGSQHVSHDEWIPTLPRIPKSEHVDEWYALQDAYIENPTDENFFAYYDLIDGSFVLDNGINRRYADRRELTEGVFPSNAEGGAKSRFLSVQFAAHLFRQEHIDGGKDRMARPITGFDRSFSNYIHNNSNSVKGTLNNPMWNVGDFHRSKQGSRAWDFPEEAPFPPGLNTVPSGVSQADHSEQIKLNWFMMSWTFDPALAKTCCGNSARHGEYFLDALARPNEIGPLETTIERHISYPIHAMYVFTKTFVSSNYDPYAVKCSARGCPEVVFDTHTRNFLGYNKHVKNTPRGFALQRAMYIDFTLNAMRMVLYLAEEKVDSGARISKSFVTKRLERVESFIEHAAKTNENRYIDHDRALYARVSAKLKALYP